MLTCAEHFNIAQVLERLRAYRVENTVSRVTRSEPEVFPAYGEEKYHVAMMDYGVKQHMIECLRRRGCKVTALPASTPAEAVLSGGYDGVMLSNGPGDPAENTAIIEELKKLYHAGDIIVVPETTNEMLPELKTASALVTEREGSNSHGAIVGLTLDIPVIVGAEHAVDILKNGAVVTVDAETGAVSGSH